MEYQNLLAVLEQSVKKRGEKTCLRYVENGNWKSLSWNSACNQVKKIAGGLSRFGIKKGDRIAILSKTRYEWTLADLAIMAVGGITVPIYESTITEQVEYILNDCAAKIVFVENSSQFRKILTIKPNIPSVIQVVLFERLDLTKVDGVYSLADLMVVGLTGDQIFQKSLKEIQPSDTASLVYTSGTTGNPKGVILTHENFLSEIKCLKGALPIEDHYVSLLFLPLAHIFARVSQFSHIYHGFIQCYAESIDKLMDNIATVQPHFLASVPRIFEKIHTSFFTGLNAFSPRKKQAVQWALRLGLQRSNLLQKKQSIPFSLAVKYQLAHRLVFKKLHQKLGGRFLYFISGGAPLSSEISGFFHACGLPILEGYGLTETTAAISINCFKDFKLASVGKPSSGVHVKIAEDGEILVIGKMVFKGYYNDPQATAEAIDAQGWFHTGDIGAFDENGFLHITDRKKDIIITAGGKNIAPQNIENIMKTDPFISQFVVHGDKRKFLSALVTLNQSEVEKYAKDQAIKYLDYADLVKNEKIQAFMTKRIEEKNKVLAKYETIKCFLILPHDFTVESGELTPTLKIKRKIITNNYQEQLDRFYRE